jgi:tetratricopeptide (TPR) repeat protein
VQRAEIARAQRKPTQDLDAYDWFLRGMAIVHTARSDRMEEARAMFDRARAADRGYAAAHGMAAYATALRREAGSLAVTSPEIAEAADLAGQAAAAHDIDATVLSCAARALAFLAGDVTGGALLAERACAINPNAAMAWNNAGVLSIVAGEAEAAVAKFERAMRLSPVDPFFCRFLGGLAHAGLVTGRYDEAATWAERSLGEHPGYAPAMRFRAAAHALAGRIEEARDAMAELRRVAPLLRLGNYGDWMPPYRNDADTRRLLDGLRLAGLPE